MRILDLRRPGSATAAQIDPKRKGTFTTNILAYVQDRPVALYFTGWQHAGENLAQVAPASSPRFGAAHSNVRCALAQHESGV